jgi:hypothetical protein
VRGYRLVVTYRTAVTHSTPPNEGFVITRAEVARTGHLM